jgi:hypothetical protein
MNLQHPKYQQAPPAYLLCLAFVLNFAIISDDAIVMAKFGPRLNIK